LSKGKENQMKESKVNPAGAFNEGLRRSWSTASFGGNADTSPMELMSLGDHLGVCKSAHGHLFAIHCAAETMRGFMVTTLVVLLLLIGIANFML
jgi:hypothetical protein